MRPILILSLVAFLMPPALAAEGPLFMWRAEKDGATIHLLGSIHAGEDSWYPLDPRIDDALAAADTVACEIDLSDPAVAMKAAMMAQQHGMYPSDDSLRDHVSEEVWTELAARLEGTVPPAILERMRPGLAAVSLAQATIAEAGLDLTAGIDMHVLERAKELGKPVVALETVEQQIDLLFGPDAVIDALMLEEALAEDAETMLAMLEDLVAAWQAGDPEALEKAYRQQWLDDARMRRFHEKLLVTRNARMAEGLADRRGHWFAVVGALHLAGEDGVPALLADAGWKVAQVGAMARR